jgi:hypothetical protein
MSNTYTRYPLLGGGGGVTIYTTFSSLPAGLSTGTLGVTADTGYLYEYNGTTWVPIAAAFPTTIPNGGTSGSSTLAYSVLSNNTSVANTLASNQLLILGAPGFTDTGISMQTTATVSGYYQRILQNTLSQSSASADYIVSNNLGTATTFYGDFGINSSTYSGPGSLNLPNATYVYSQNGDLALGTASQNPIHFVVNSGTTDALTIGTSSLLIVPAFSSNGVVVNSASGILASVPVLPQNLGGTNSAAGTPTFSNVTSSTSFYAANGTVGAPAYSFTNDTTSGMFKSGTSDVQIACGGILGMDATKVGTNVNFGFGVAASSAAGSPVVFNSSLNGTQFFVYTNTSAGTVSGTVLQIGNGAGSNFTTVENYANTTAGYLAGGSLIGSGINQTQLNITAEYSLAYMAFNLGGRTLATEKLRLTSGAMTYNGGLNFVMIGSSAAAVSLTQSAPLTAGSSYSITWPNQFGVANAALTSNGSGSALSWTVPSFANTVGSVSFSQIAPGTQFTIGSVTVTSSTGGNKYTVSFPGSLGSPNQALSISSGSALTWSSVLTNPLTTSGDIIVSSGSGNIQRLAVGTGGQVLTVSTSSLIPSWGTLTAPTKQVVSSGSATYTTPTGAKWLKITIIGGGGSGGGCAATGATTGAAAGGGGGGGWSIGWISSPAPTYTYTVGAGGAAPAQGNNAGNAGGTSLFSGLTMNAIGGTGGAGAGTASGPVFGSLGAAGGAGSGGTISGGGGPGLPGIILGSTGGQGLSGAGGSSIMGAGGQASQQAGNGSAGSGFGSGGSGGAGGNSQVALTGGAGAPGVVIVEEFYQ